MWTGLKENSEYSAQITPYGGRVNAEIICKDNDFYDRKLDLWLSVCNKSFGSIWRSAPTEKDWQKATKWVEEQLSLIGKYGTVVVTEPEFLRQIKKSENNNIQL